jgi:hypothetical protein
MMKQNTSTQYFYDCAIGQTRVQYYQKQQICEPKQNEVYFSGEKQLQ